MHNIHYQSYIHGTSQAHFLIPVHRMILSTGGIHSLIKIELAVTVYDKMAS